MTAIKVTVAQARAMGVNPSPAPVKRTTRTVAAGPYATVCKACGATFTTMASEDRHVTLTHSRFELVL